MNEAIHQILRRDQAGGVAAGDRVDAICRWAFPLGYATLIALPMIGYLGF